MQGSEARPPEGAKLAKFRRIISQLKPPIIRRNEVPAPHIDILSEPTPSKARRIMTRTRDKLARKYKPAAILAGIPPLQGAGGILVGSTDVQTHVGSNQEETRILTSSASSATATGPFTSDDLVGDMPFQSNVQEVSRQTFNTHHTSGGTITNANRDYIINHNYNHHEPCCQSVSAAVDCVTVPRASLLDITANQRRLERGLADLTEITINRKHRGDITIVVKRNHFELFAILFA
ncbi:hypothetical protein FIBSPDRAFT_879738 [Athelia psychrophila]|uniref:Uncharacterized protein n=1 Tax=Athelia psychrophila TaxID=1759441 RepID=A0A167TMY6_9AGAM|nr:hypothetical protein FIBSPDRAFT_879738 [Fibularhizoctonia sp. CBS 109695]